MKKMQMWDKHFELKEPIKSKQIGEALAQGVRDALQSKGVNIEEYLRSYDEKEHRHYWRQRQIDHYNQFDLSILDSLDLTVDDILNLQKEKIRRKAVAAKRPAKEADKERFLSIVIECEKEGLTFAQTKRRLTDEIRTTTEKTIETWLKDLQQSPHCNIPAPHKTGKG